ncbi:hypothetical protein F5879DRAFT_991465 [Lentinula edodes]|nr:hypothetical protein F5879DRAFT_991465 [Lentinula edodes]
MSPKRTTYTQTRTKNVGPATQYRNRSTRGQCVIMENSSTALASGGSGSPSSPSDTANNDSASSDSSIIPASSARILVDIDSIHGFPMLPSGREEYLERQGRTDELVKGLDTLHAASGKIFRTQKEEICLRRHQISVLKEQSRKYQETICLMKLMQEREHRCPGCENLAWDPQILICGHTVCSRCASNEQLAARTSGQTKRCPKCRAFICRPPIPSITIRHAINSIATKLGKVPPSPPTQ